MSRAGWADVDIMVISLLLGKRLCCTADATGDQEFVGCFIVVEEKIDFLMCYFSQMFRK